MERRLLWEPSPQKIEQANISDYIKEVNRRYGLELQNYDQLWQWSVEQPVAFWNSLWQYFNIIHSQPFTQVVTNLDAFPPETKWFTGARLNFAENLLRYRDDHLALIFEAEDGSSRQMTYKELYLEVAKVAEKLRQLGVGPEDRVVGYMPNLIETIVAMLAATSLGATWSSCGAELGPDAAHNRLGQIQPKVMFTVDAYTYKGKEFDQQAKAAEVAAAIDSLVKVVVVPFVQERPDITVAKGVGYNEFKVDGVQTIDFAQVDFSHPLYIMFSSGTTGKPKCMVQSVGGILINHMKELILHTDLDRESRLFYLTSPSWMMWNWTVSTLSVGATIVLYEGNPLYPDWGRAWQMIENYKVNVFGCSASYLHYLKKIDATPGESYNLESLTQISQTGSALSEEGFTFVYEEIKQDLHFNSISGGTDINGCFAAGVPILPVYSGQLQARALGMKVAAYNDEADPVVDEQAELVCELPSPSMPIYFFEDEGNKRYQDAYFGYFDKQVWRHGDYIEIDGETGGVKFYGRSDSVLKPSGVRIGTAEIYNIVEEFSKIVDSLAIGRDVEGDQEVILFVQMAEGQELSDELQRSVASKLRSKASPRHVPSRMVSCPDIPYTFSGKKVESAITNILHDRPVKNAGAMRNPEALEFYRQFASSLK